MFDLLLSINAQEAHSTQSWRIPAAGGKSIAMATQTATVLAKKHQSCSENVERQNIIGVSKLLCGFSIYLQVLPSPSYL